MDRLQVRQLVIVGVDAHAEKQAGVPPIDDLQGAELDEVGLVFLVARGDEAVDLEMGGFSGRVGGEEREGGV